MMNVLSLSLILAVSTTCGNSAPQQLAHTSLNSGRECGSFEAVIHIWSLADKVVDSSHLHSQLLENGGAAALHNSDTDVRSWTHKCGAALISQRYLLTAAHCLITSERLVSISLGRSNLEENTNPNSANIYKIEESIIHPDYNRSRDRYNDIAILKTNRPVQYGPEVWPYCLPDINEVYDDRLPVVIAGWGKVNQSHKASVIKSAFIRITENSRCANLWKTLAPPQYEFLVTYDYPNGLTSKILCGYRLGVDACEGDSGGPMTYQREDGVNTVIGIVARGISHCPDRPIVPGLYTNVAHYIDWIYSTTGLPRPLSNPTKILDHDDPELCGFFDSSTDCLKSIVSNQCKILCANASPTDGPPNIQQTIGPSTNQTPIPAVISASCIPTCTRGTCKANNTCSCSNEKSTNECQRELYEAARKGEVKYVSDGLASGLSPDWLNENAWGDSALMTAAQNGHVNVIAQLLRAGADLELADSRGWTALHYAAFNKHSAATAALLQAGANVNARDVEGQTPLMYAAQNGRVGVMEVLLADPHIAVNQADNAGWTALHWAAWQNKSAAARLLLEKGGADKTRVNNDGQTPAALARVFNNPVVAKIIQDF